MGQISSCCIAVDKPRFLMSRLASLKFPQGARHAVPAVARAYDFRFLRNFRRVVWWLWL